MHGVTEVNSQKWLKFNLISMKLVKQTENYFSTIRVDLWRVINNHQESK